MKNDNTMIKLRNTQLEILDEFVKICNKHKLDYFLCGGSMLGAIRHKGFIPWDDDIDVGMTRKDYDKFIQIAIKELNKKYYLDCFENNKNCFLPYAKIRKNGTIFDEEESHDLNNHKGIFIDIFPFDNAKKASSLIQTIQGIMVRSITDVMFCKNNIRKIKDTQHPFISYLLNIFSKNFLMNWQNRIMHWNKNDNTEYLVALSGRYNVKKETSKRNIFVPGRVIIFENRKYNGMNKPDIYLSKIYGDYMKLPPKDKRVTHMPLKIEFDDELVKK